MRNEISVKQWILLGLCLGCMALVSTTAIASPPVITWGATNSYGLANIPTNLTNVIAVSAGNTHSIAQQADRKVVAWGGNYNGQTNVPLSATNVVGIAAAWDHTVALRSDGTAVSWGDMANVPAGLSNVVAIAVGDYHSLALRSDGTLVLWTNNSSHSFVTKVLSGLSNVVVCKKSPI